MSESTNVKVVETLSGKYTNDITTSGGHHMIADEPKDLGGDDKGATPYDFLLSALGSCKSMTMRMYAEHKGYKLDNIEVHLSHKKIHAKDCKNCESEKGLIDYIETNIKITGNLSEEERLKIFQIAEKCPVHRTIMNEIYIESILAD